MRPAGGQCAALEYVCQCLCIRPISAKAHSRRSLVPRGCCASCCGHDQRKQI